MKVFISGASGLVGSNCLKHFTEEGHEVVGTYFSYPTKNTVYFNTLDLNDEKNFHIENFKPDIIVHCGALTHVDYCEDHQEESYEKTVVSTKNLILLAEQLNARLVYISTDYVFDGAEGPYMEYAEVNPLSVYAKHKLEGELLVLKSSDKNLVLRVTNVYGNEERNKNFVSRIIGQCLNAQKLTLKLPQDQYATPVNAWDIARAMCLLLKDEHAGIFHIASTDWMNRVELALNVLKYFPDAEYDLIPVTTEIMNQPAARPLRGGLLKSKFSELYPEFLFSNVDSFVQCFVKP
ncbi:MAG TPA: SDR family oxidoreductase [Chitinophagaceae bacterium]|nr:SDR family oxidoreductase [Chitinophagaceae bacterium]